MSGDQLRVFVSSSMAELAEERHEVVEALRDLDLDVILMEELGASARGPLNEYREQLAKADLVVSLFWRKLGEFTAYEVNEARRRRVPLLVYVKNLADPDDQRSPELEDLLGWLEDPETGVAARHYDTADVLGRFVQRDVRHLLGERLSADATVAAQAVAASGVPVPDEVLAALTSSLRFTSTGDAIESWDEVMDLAREKGRRRNWVFRGQADSGWGLSTALERTAMKFDIPWKDVPRLENDLIVRFQRQLGNFQADVPAEDSRIEWLALMQHHGAPTRLLDWSHSFYVALLFALEDAEIGTPCAIWALDAEWCRELATRSLDDDEASAIAADPTLKQPSTVKSVLFRDDPVPLVFPISPFRLNERLVLQQGVFVTPADVALTFQENLDKCARRHDERLRLEKTEIVCTPQLLRDAVRELHRMNVNRATLFPGLDGFSAHLGNLAVARDLIALDVTGATPEQDDRSGRGPVQAEDRSIDDVASALLESW